MIRQSTLFYLAAILVFSFTMYIGHGAFLESSSEAVSVTDRGLFVIANSYPDNSSTPAFSGVVMNELVAGQWGTLYRVSVADDAPHVLNFKAYDNQGTDDEAMLLNATFTISGDVEVFLGLGTRNLDGLYTEVTWT